MLSMFVADSNVFLCLEVVENMAEAPDIVFLDSKQRHVYLQYNQTLPKTKYDTLTLDDLRRILAHIQELFCYNIQVYERMIKTD